ncbi:polysaccharide biosynthesis/export family protein [Planctomicrobium sp. SH668]|uniref:polysaccharide biosynthesis/export family protein n=1 Tax=Planctomicrobium sp. SH668 TaxID=3448126 RepID=UPI003F5C2071
MSKVSSNQATCRTESAQLMRGIGCLMLLLLFTSGCTAMRPIRGVPASYLPEYFEGPSRDNKRTIDLSLLVRTQPDQHRVGAGDVLSIYVPRVLGSQSTEVNSVGIEPPINMPASIEESPTVGYPIQVRDDNTIPLPQIPPLQVGGMTLHEVELAIRKAYSVDHKILNPDEAMVLVSLQRPRIHRVLVVRQEADASLSAGSQPGTVNIGTTGKGTAKTVTLKAYENDVLHALSEGEGVNGLPGLNAENVIYVIRRRPRDFANRSQPVADPNFPHGNQYPVPPQQIPGIPMGATQNPSGIHQVSHSQPAQNPQPFGGYRGQADVGGHSFSSVQQTPMSTPVAAAPSGNGIIPAQYSPYEPTPAMEEIGGGHSWNPAPQAQYGRPPQATYGHGGDLGWGSMLQNFDPTMSNPNIIRIPIRLGPGEQPNITEESITLYDGDIVFIDSRETEVFYTAGLLGGGQYTLPRDYDLGVLEAISIAEGRSSGGTGLARSIGGVSALNHDVSNSASRLAILRTLPNGKRVTLEVDLKKAMRYQQENIRIQPGDILFLQYTMPEAACAFFQRYLLEGALFSVAAAQLQSGGQ